ncbi:hypothetical protein H1R20_g15495, partial [Candolleomyces eurysporus]
MTTKERAFVDDVPPIWVSEDAEIVPGPAPGERTAMLTVDGDVIINEPDYEPFTCVSSPGSDGTDSSHCVASADWTLPLGDAFQTSDGEPLVGQDFLEELLSFLDPATRGPLGLPDGSALSSPTFEADSYPLCGTTSDVTLEDLISDGAYFAHTESSEIPSSHVFAFGGMKNPPTI